MPLGLLRVKSRHSNSAQTKLNVWIDGQVAVVSSGLTIGP